MTKFVFDIETDGFLNVLTRVHSLVLYETTTESMHSVSMPVDVESYLRKMMEADYLIGHNILGFDFPALQKVYPWFTFDVDKVIDTLVLSRMLYGNLRDQDVIKGSRSNLPRKLYGSHSLEAWGYRLGILKGEFGKATDWAEWSPDMQRYCERDVEVNLALLKHFEAKGWSYRAASLEMWFQYIMAKQQQAGFPFDKDKAVALYLELMKERNRIDKELEAYFPPWMAPVKYFVPKRDHSGHGYTADAPLTQVKEQIFNPGSRHQIADRLQRLYGWRPKLFTPSGQPQIDEVVLSELSYPPAQLLARRFLVDKRIGQISEGDQAWLKLVEADGKIHGYVNTLGAVTGRCTHSAPNMAQVPAVRSPYGADCRAMFHAPEGWVQVGADASGLELRCLGHYMARYDGGEYVNVLLHGDVHTANMQAAGVANRDQAKTFIYAYLYGAGDEKIGSIVGGDAKAGAKLKRNFLKRTPALKRLREAVSDKAKSGFLMGIDGRWLPVRHQHAALNTLLQSAGALIVKQATVNFYQAMTAAGHQWGQDWVMVAHIHDEYQVQCRAELADIVADMAVESFRQAGRDFEWRCPIDGEAKIGRNWAECH